MLWLEQTLTHTQRIGASSRIADLDAYCNESQLRHNDMRKSAVAGAAVVFQPCRVICILVQVLW
jgi:hypothetical protein